MARTLELPEGFLYKPDSLSEAEEHDLLEHIRRLEFSQVKMHGVVAKRRAAHFGWLYQHESWRIAPGPPIPDFLLPVRKKLADLTSIPAEDFVEALVTEYPPGAGIGWHRDAPQCGVVAVVSLLGPCRMRFRAGPDTRSAASELEIEPRSAYAITGAARSKWQHGIPPTKQLRYSVTFRTLWRRAPHNSTVAVYDRR